MDFAEYYSRNLRYLRELSGEFARENPGIARRLLLSEVDDRQDPYIERLLEGTAFIAAKVEKRLDEGYYGLLESIVNSVCPEALYPVASGAVVEVITEIGDKKGFVIEAGRTFDVGIPGITTVCRFSCAADTAVVPFKIVEAEYLGRDMVGLGLGGGVESALRLEFSEGLGNSGDISVFLNLSENDASVLLRLLVEDIEGVYVKSGGGYRELSGVVFKIPLFDGEGFIGGAARAGVKGLRILRNYLSYPDFFKFFSIMGIGGISGCSEVVIGFKRRESSLTAAVKATSIRLNCIPVLNLFSHHSLRTSFDGEVVFNPYEFHVVAEKNAVEDYEVVCVKKIDFYNGHNEHVVRAVNFYDGVGYSGEKANIFFSIKRRRRLFGSSRSKYEGTEVFVSFSPVPPGGVNQFSGDFLLTNRDLPGILRKQSGILKGDIPLTISGLASSRAFFLTLPTEPGYPLSEQGGEKDFSRLSHIVMNLSSMLCQEGEGALMFLRNMLMSYSSLRLAEDTERLALGIKEFSGKRGAFRFIQEGAIFYEWGWRFRLVLDEKAYGGIGFYQFAHVVGQMLLSLTPLNTILELELSTLQSGVITQWSTLENR